MGERADRLKKIAVDALLGLAVQQLAGGGIAVDQLSRAIVGDNAVAHMQKERVELVALVFYRFKRGVEDGRHVVEGGRQDADLVCRLHGEGFVKIAGGNALGALGQLLDGVDHRLGKQERKQNGNEQTHQQRLQNDEQQLRVERGYGGAVVTDVDDEAVVAAGDGDRHIHVAGGKVAVVAHLAVACGKNVFRLLQGVGAVVAGSKHLAGLRIEDVVVAVARIDAERAGGGLQHGLQAHRAVLLRAFLAQRADEVGIGLAEHLAHLLVEIVNVEVGDAGHQKCADHRHQGGDEQQHDHHKLHMQAAKHGRYSFRKRSARAQA